MSKLYAFLISLCLLGTFTISAQAQELCGTDLIHEKLMKEDPNYRNAVNIGNQAWAKYVQEKQTTAQRPIITNGDTIFEIPVVIHVLHTGGAIGSVYNPSDQDLEDWIDFVNAVYAGTYSGYPQVGNGGVSLPVRFALAKRDPNCNPTNGIERINLSSNTTYINYGMRLQSNNGLTENQVVDLSQWPTNAYYNIYVVNKFNGEDGINPQGAYYTGYAYLGINPSLPANDGAYMLASVAQVGKTTFPHEIGHAFGLFHVFEGGSQTVCPTNNNCATEGDYVCDTDPSRNLLGTCPSANAINPCTNTPYGINGIQNNLMNYGNCRNLFTEGQAERMMYMLINNRASLINSIATLPPSSTIPTPIAASCQPAGIANANNTYRMGPCAVLLDSIQSITSSLNPSLNDYYIDHTETCHFPISSTTLEIGQSYTLQVTTHYNQQSVRAYIDFNNNGIFEPATETIISGNTNSTPSTTIYDTIANSFIVPNTAVTNTPLRMRVLADTRNNSNLGPCSQLTYGQAEDFMVVVKPSNPMPLKLLTFKGEWLQEKQARLFWEIAPNQSEGLGFHLRRSVDGKNFKTVGFVPFNPEQNYYEFLDLIEETQDLYFYQLVFEETAGTELKSTIIELNAKTQPTSLTLYPNPTSNIVNVKSSHEIEILKVIDLQGRTIIKQHLTQSLQKDLVYPLDVSTLIPGHYLIQMIDIFGNSHSQRFTKE